MNRQKMLQDIERQKIYPKKTIKKPMPNRKNICAIGNVMRVHGNGHQPKQRVNEPALKYVDTFGSNINVMATGTVLPGLDQIAQGSGVSQRVGNRIYHERLFLNYNIVQVNTDIVSQSRLIIFQFFPNSSFLTPVVLDILETANDVQSMYNFEFSNQYRIIYDQIHFQSGTATNPTASSNVGFYGEVDITSTIKALEFTGASALGSHQFYMLIISDSLVAPFPQLDYTTRLLYRE